MADTCPRRGFNDVGVGERGGGGVVGGEVAVKGGSGVRWSGEKMSPGMKGTGKVEGESLKSL